jgi:hypothetical protein
MRLSAEIRRIEAMSVSLPKTISGNTGDAIRRGLASWRADRTVGWAADGRHRNPADVCDLLGIRYPIPQGTMQGGGGVELVGAVSDFGWQSGYLRWRKDSACGALHALLAFAPSDTRNGVVAHSTRHTWPSMARKKWRKRNWPT